MIDIGQRIRQLRMKNDLTLEELASRTELTKGFLSQLERNLTSPSLQTLDDIASALGVTMSRFFAADQEEQVVFTAEDEFVDEQDDYTIHWIIPNAQKNQMEPIRVTMRPGGCTYVDDPHEGEEFGYVIKGSVDIHLGDRVCKAGSGESFYYTSDSLHYLSSKGGAELIWVAAPPSF